MEMSDLRIACSVTRWEGKSNESVYERSGMGTFANGMKWVVEQVRRNTMRWFGHIEEFVKSVCK